MANWDGDCPCKWNYRSRKKSATLYRHFVGDGQFYVLLVMGRKLWENIYNVFSCFLTPFFLFLGGWLSKKRRIVVVWHPISNLLNHLARSKPFDHFFGVLGCLSMITWSREDKSIHWFSFFQGFLVVFFQNQNFLIIFLAFVYKARMIAKFHVWWWRSNFYLQKIIVSFWCAAVQTQATVSPSPVSETFHICISCCFFFAFWFSFTFWMPFPLVL